MEQTNPLEKEFDYTFDTVEEETVLDNEVQDEEVVESESTPTETVEKFKVKYNGQEMELTKDELITNAQKGMNYEKVLSERDSLKPYAELIKELDELAKENNVDTKDFVKGLKESKQQEKLNKRITELEAEGMSKDHAKRMAELEFKQPKVEQKVENKEFDTLTNDFKTLHAEFPETQGFKELSDFPQEVVDLIKQGKSPLVAYTKYQVDTLKKQSEIDKTKAINKVKDTGSLGSIEDNKKKDPFLEGFLGR